MNGQRNQDLRLARGLSRPRARVLRLCKRNATPIAWVFGVRVRSSRREGRQPQQKLHDYCPDTLPNTAALVGVMRA